MSYIIFKEVDAKSNLLRCVKLIKELTGWGLRDAKDFADLLYRKSTTNGPPSSEVSEYARIRKLPLFKNERGLGVDVYVDEFCSFGFNCVDGRKDKLKNFLIEDLRVDTKNGDEDRIKTIDKASNQIIEDITGSISFESLNSEMTELEKHTFVSILSKKISEKLKI